MPATGRTNHSPATGLRARRPGQAPPPSPSPPPLPQPTLEDQIFGWDDTPIPTEEEEETAEVMEPPTEPITVPPKTSGSDIVSRCMVPLVACLVVVVVVLWSLVKSVQYTDHECCLDEDEARF